MRSLRLLLATLVAQYLVAADPAPSYGGGDGRTFWYASALDWRFKADGYAQNTLSDDLMPERLVELLVWQGRVEEVEGKAAGKLRWNATAALCWRASGRSMDGLQGEGITVHWPFGALGGVFTQQPAAGAEQCLPGSGELVIDTATATVPGYRMKDGHDFGVVITGLGLPDLAIASAPSAGVTRQVQPPADGVVEWSWSEPAFQRKLDRFISAKVSLGGMPVQVNLSALAQGAASGRMALDERSHLPVWSCLEAQVTVTLTPELAQPAAPGQAISGVLTMRRHAWRLVDQDRATMPQGLPALLKALAATALIDGRPKPWEALAKEGDATWARVARGVLHSGSHPLQPVAADAK